MAQHAWMVGATGEGPGLESTRHEGPARPSHTRSPYFEHYRADLEVLSFLPCRFRSTIRDALQLLFASIRLTRSLVSNMMASNPATRTKGAASSFLLDERSRRTEQVCRSTLEAGEVTPFSRRVMSRTRVSGSICPRRTSPPMSNGWGSRRSRGRKEPGTRPLYAWRLRNRRLVVRKRWLEHADRAAAGIPLRRTCSARALFPVRP